MLRFTESINISVAKIVSELDEQNVVSSIHRSKSFFYSGKSLTLAELFFVSNFRVEDFLG